MKKNIKTIIGLVIAFVIGISTTVGAATIFRSEDITYESDKTEVTNVKDSLDELYSKVGSSDKCPDGYMCIELKTISSVNIGDYISMMPTSTSYTPKSEDTGCMNDENCTQNTINPSELNLWRVIRINNDGTVDVVSEYTSSAWVRFYGSTGYLNLVGGLNEIAAQYTNEKYVQSTRHIGYSNQIEICTALSTTACPTDTGYETDTNLVKTAMGTLNAKGISSDLNSSYWIASRYSYSSLQFSGRYLSPHSSSPSVSTDTLVSYNAVYKLSYTIRPILTLKSSIKIESGDGKSAETAYQLS